MANTSISNLSAGAAVSATDLVPNVQTAGVGPVKTTAAQLKTFMSASPTLVTPILGAATGTSLALGGATIGTNALAITGTTAFTGSLLLNGSSSGVVTVQTDAAAGTWSLTLPTAVPSVAGQLLSSTTGGVSSWTSDLTYDANGLGIGAASDGSKLYVYQSGNLYATSKVENPTSGTSALCRLLLRSNTTYLNLAATSTAYTDIAGAANSIQFGINSAANGMQFTIDGAAATLRFDANSNLVLGSAAIATSATNGFFYATSCAGAPTGVPTAYTGRVPIVYDSTNNKIYVYNGGWKSTAALT